MARSQNSWGLKLFVASIVLFFCLAVTTVESRSVPFLAQLTPEYTGKVTSKNKAFVGQAFAYLATTGNEFHLSVLVVSNINPADITKVQLYNIEDKATVGDKFTKLTTGYQVLDKRINYALGEQINIEKIAVNIYTKAVGSDRAALSGVLVNNRTSYLAYLQADQEVVTPTGTTKNDGYASVIVYTDNTNYFMNIVVNHDVDQKVTEIHLHAPAASNTNGFVVYDFPSFLGTNAAKALNIQINATVYYWLNSHLGYINIHTTKNTAGALRGQVIPTTSSRIKVPTFPNLASANGITGLPDGSFISGDVGINLQQGGARNLTGNATDPRVAVFIPANNTFNNDFRFVLPVTIKNRHQIRAASVFLSAAAETVDNAKFNFGLFNLATQVTDTSHPVTGTGRRNFQTYRIDLDADQFPNYLGPGGLFVNINGASLVDNLYVDELFVIYYVNSAYGNNILKSVFYKGSDAQ